jgi:hypothetical protein
MDLSDRVPIPPPPVVREQLARNLRENRLLRALLRLSLKADEELRLDTPRTNRQPQQAVGQGVAR